MTENLNDTTNFLRYGRRILHRVQLRKREKVNSGTIHTSFRIFVILFGCLFGLFNLVTSVIDGGRSGYLSKVIPFL